MQQKILRLCLASISISESDSQIHRSGLLKIKNMIDWTR